jgi:serine/threonine protein kinase
MYLHDNNVCHRDLKLENILMSRRSKSSLIKITDFGLSKVIGFNRSEMTSFVGTMTYIAPEVILAKGTHQPYSNMADMWFVCLFTRGPLF